MIFRITKTSSGSQQREPPLTGIDAKFKLRCVTPVTEDDVSLGAEKLSDSYTGVWEIEIDTLEQLIELVNNNVGHPRKRGTFQGRIMLSVTQDEAGRRHLEIYDTWRE